MFEAQLIVKKTSVTFKANGNKVPTATTKPNSLFELILLVATVESNAEKEIL